MQLTPEHRRAVDDLLRRRGEECPQCGSTDLTSNGEYYGGRGGQQISVQYVCLNRGTDEQHPSGYGPFSTVLGPHEARSIGLS